MDVGRYVPRWQSGEAGEAGSRYSRYVYEEQVGMQGRDDNSAVHNVGNLF
jgi:hypothetical protein